MDEQELNKAAKEYAIANPMSKRTETFKAGANWREQQNPWRKVEDELPDIKKWVTIKKSDGTFYSISFQNKELIKALRHTFIEWKYIE